MPYWWFESQSDRIERKLDRALDLLHTILKDVIMAYEAELTAAEAAAKANSDAEDSAEGLLTSLNALIATLKTAQTDPVTAKRITDLTAAITARTAQLAAAVVAGTPAA